MASLSSDKKGNRVIQFMLGKRWTVRLGDVLLATARKVKGHIEDLIAAMRMGQAVEDRTAKWVADLHDDLHAKLAAVELVALRTPEVVTLGPFLDMYVAGRKDIKQSAAEVWRKLVHNQKALFGADRDLATIHECHADDFKQCLIGEKLSTYMVAKRLQFARMLFRAILRRRLIPTNSFGEVGAKAIISKETRFVTLE